MEVNQNIFDIANKKVVITGTSRGIGYTLAEAFLENGAIVCGVSRSESDLIKFKNYTHFNSDLSKQNSIKKLVNNINNKISFIDILINCAGISIPIHNNYENYDISFKETLDINLTAAFYLCCEVSKIMRQKNKGSIVNVSSICANLGFPLNPAYVSSKSALSGLTRSLAYDFAPFGIRVNNLVPGYFLTDMTKSSYFDPEKKDERSSRSLLSRWGNTKELIGSAIFLSSDASSFVTGIDLVVDGGWSIKGL